jgi:hypothetical protein
VVVVTVRCLQDGVYLAERTMPWVVAIGMKGNMTPGSNKYGSKSDAYLI